MTKAILGVLVIALGSSVGCGPDERPAIQNEASGGCVMHHPVTWTVAGTTCVEDQTHTADTFMADGQSVQIYAVPYEGTSFGNGSSTQLCDVAYGGIRQTSASCRPSVGSTF